MKPGEIPICDAADICKKRGCAYVIVFGLREDGERFHITTYGMTKALCKVAGAVGDKFAEAVLDGRVHPPQTEPADKRTLAEIESMLRGISQRCGIAASPRRIAGEIDRVANLLNTWKST